MPTYNEAENIAVLLGQILAVLPQAQVLVVDDDSPDGTAGIVRELRDADTRINLWERPAKMGLGSAYIATFLRLATCSDAELVCTIDADFSHDPTVLPELIAHTDRHEVVIGSRYVAGGRLVGWSPWRRALSRAGNAYARLVAGVPVRDLTSGLVCFRRTILARIPLAAVHSSGYAYTIESKCLAYQTGARIKEIPITFVERRRGRSKFGAGIVVEGLLAPWRIRMRRNPKVTR